MINKNDNIFFRFTRQVSESGQKEQVEIPFRSDDSKQLLKEAASVNMPIKDYIEWKSKIHLCKIQKEESLAALKQLIMQIEQIPLEEFARQYEPLSRQLQSALRNLLACERQFESAIHPTPDSPKEDN